MDADGNELQQLTQKGGNYHDWSPDGKYIVFNQNNFAEFGDENGRLWVMDADGKNKSQLTFSNKLGQSIVNLINKVKKITYLRSVLIMCLVLISYEKNPFENGNGVEPPSPVYPEIDQSPAWSPDGSVIVYHHNGTTTVNPSGSYHVEPDSVGLWFISPAGDNKRMFLKGANWLPAWSPDGECIAFVNGAKIYNIKVNGDSLTQLTFEGRNFYPAWSTDRVWIAYDSDADSPNGMKFIWKMRVDGSEKRRIAYEPEMGEIRMPHWALDGKKIVHIRYLVGTFSSEIFVMDSSGTSPLRITFNNATDYYPKYSSDGLKIVFSSQEKTGGPPQVWVMDSDGGNLRQLTQKGGTSPAWSPDGSLIVYTRYNSAEFSDENGHLWIMDSNGENKRQLTHFKDNSL